MELDQKTRQKWEVLWYFVQNTGSVLDSIDNVKCGVVLERETGEKRFYSYPSRIHADFENPRFSYGRKSITKDWARVICENLSELGILDHDDIRAPRQRSPTPHYYLKPGVEPFLKVMKFLLDPPELVMMRFNLSNGYVQHHLNAELVRHVLAARGTEMRRSIPIWEWDAAEAPKVFEQYYQRMSVGGIPAPCSFEEYVREMWLSHERGKQPSLIRFPPTIPLRLPVIPEHLSEDERVKAVVGLNSDRLKDYSWLLSHRSGIDGHYARYEHEKWVIPILALIRASPEALKGFLFGDWKPYGLEPSESYCFTADGTGCMQYPLFQLLFTAIRDIAMIRDVDSDRLVEFVRFRPDFRQHPYRMREGHSALMEIDLTNRMIVSYDGSFDTDHTFYGEDLIMPDEETNFSFQSLVEIRCFHSGGDFFAPDDIPVLDGLLRTLRDGRTLAARSIFSRLSHPVQNMLWVYTDEGLEKESWFAGVVLQDLNRLLIRPDLYSPAISPELTLTREGKHVVEHRENIGDINYQVSIFGLTAFNRELLERVFPGDVPERKREEWNNTRYFE
ncbi:MAG: hypothetical protein GX216_11375 [Methanomicrobiales archaeon]|nr:hypothetical protein [Methanomicrobiales archaeon]